MIKTNLIVARTKNCVIGKDGEIPWHLPADLALFGSITAGNAVVMGRGTMESLPAKLKNRYNILVSNTVALEDCDKVDAVVKSLSEARDLACRLGYGELWVIGGERLYEEAKPIVDEMWITEIYDTVPYELGDKVARFVVDLDRRRWVQTRNSVTFATDAFPTYSFDVWKRRSKPHLYANDFILYEPEEFITK